MRREAIEPIDQARRFTGVALHGDWLGPGDVRSLDQELYADFDELRRERAKTHAAIEEWVAALRSMA